MEKEELEQLVAEGLSVRAIAARVGRSPATVRHWLRRHELRTEAAQRRVGRDPTARRAAGNCREHGETELVRRGDGAWVCVRCRAERVAARRRRVKQLLVDEAGGRCLLCGYDRCVAALEFHHLDPATKRFGLGSRGLALSIERLREEAAKCVLLCSNCHAEVEAGVTELSSAALRGAG